MGLTHNCSMIAARVPTHACLIASLAAPHFVPYTLSYRQTDMAEFSQKWGKRHDDDMLGSAVDFLLANARLVLGMGGAAVLGIATLAVKRVRPRWTSYTWGSQRRMTGLEPTVGSWVVG